MSSEAELERRTEHIPEWKQAEVDELIDFIEAHATVGVVGVTGIPSRQFQAMRADLHGSAAVRMSRNTLLGRALEAIDEGVEELSAYLSGQVALVGTDDNPFTLYRQLEESKTPAPINAGEIAPNDIVIEAGDTGLDPGPFVGELQNVGASAQILEGSIKITEDSVVAEAGDVVSDDLANVLAELEIEPKEVGLDLRGVFADGVVFEAEDLSLDLDEYRADVETAAARARTLSINAAVPTRRTAASLLAKASGEARSVGLAAAIESPALAGDLVSRADARVRSLAANLPDEALPEELRGVDVARSAEPGTDEPAATDTDTDADADAGTESEIDDTATEDADADTDADGDTDDESGGDEDVSGEGLGDLFG